MRNEVKAAKSETLEEASKMCEMLGFRCGCNKFFRLLGYYAA